MKKSLESKNNTLCAAVEASVVAACYNQTFVIFLQVQKKISQSKMVCCFVHYERRIQLW